jgi:hypothetical protein
MMRPAPSLVLAAALLNLPAQAAEALNNNALERTYIPEAKPCQPDQTTAKNTNCKDTPTGSLEDKTWRDAEQQNTRQQLGNPKLNNPDALPPPSQLPPPELTPLQQQLIEQIRQLPGQL